MNYSLFLKDSLDYALIEKVAEDAVLAYKGLEASSLNDAAPKDYIVELRRNNTSVCRSSTTATHRFCA